MTMLDPEDAQILRHALGLDWAPRPCRRHYVALAIGSTRRRCETMARNGWLALNGEPDLIGTQRYHVTELGALMVGQRLPR